MEVFCYALIMKIKSAKFVKGLTEAAEFVDDDKPHIAFIGRSNVGKSTLINSFTGQKDLARTSSSPGRTQQINLFLINKAFYLVDLPGYGYAKASHVVRQHLQGLIYWYFFDSKYQQKKVVVIIDALVGPTKDDLEILTQLREHQKDIVVVANKIDKMKKSTKKIQLQKIQDLIGPHVIIPYSSHDKVGLGELTNQLFS